MAFLPDFLMKEFLGMMRTALVLVLILWLLFAFVIGIKMVPNDDMSPRMNAGDIILYYKIDKRVLPKDVVVIKKNGTDYVGRIAAKGGDTIDITDEENVIINGNMIVEDNIFYSTPRYEGFNEYPVKLKENEYFILADNREGGEDSRYYGPVKTSEIKGTMIGLYRRSGF